MKKDFKVGDKIVYDNLIGTIVEVKQIMNYDLYEFEKNYIVRFEVTNEAIVLMLFEDEIEPLGDWGE